MKAEIKAAACLPEQTAQKIKAPHKPYPTVSMLSSLKMQIGQLLLCLQTPLPENDRHNYWRVFESGLSQLVDLKLCEVQL